MQKIPMTMKMKKLRIMKNNTNKYYLSTDDYVDIYPLLTPEEIVQEFEGRTKSVRTIQRLYRNMDLPSVRQAQQQILNTSYAIADLEIDEDSWMEHVVGDFENMRENIKQKIWGRINRVEQLYQELKEDYGHISS